MFPSRGVPVGRRGCRFLLALAALTAIIPSSLFASDLDDAQKLFFAGKYTECVDACTKSLTPASVPATTRAAIDITPIDLLPPIDLNPPTSNDGLWTLKTRAQLELGKYNDALQTSKTGLDINPENLTLQLLRYKALQYTGSDDAAKTLLAKLQDMITLNAWHFFDPDNRVAMGKIALMRGMDARQILENYYDKARKDDPKSLAALLAIGDLALAKNDPGVADESFQAAQKVAPDDPDVYLGIAKANDDDADLVTAAIAKSLELNPHHIDTLLMVAGNLITRERYKDASEALAKILDVNPTEPRAWAYKTVMAHLQGDHKEEDAAHAKALSTWKTNPEVDFLIGEKLSQKYRFEVGSTYQKKSLAFAPDYEPARFQLCQDLLRMGQEDEGWKIADSVFKDDPYNVEAFNLVTLHDNLKKFKTMTSDHFILRMEAKELPIYGTRVMALLNKAHDNFTAKYGVQLAEPTTVEIFPLQQDFEIRTFGFPGEEGFLGVCFGRVVTVNSPASRLSHPTSWEAVVWHEFCHTITLTKTKNKMPRWLSEGISVYEERQGNPAWGDHMLPAYRELILKDGAAKISELSQSFSQPPTPMALQFAYFQASMVVQFIIDRYGIDAIKSVLSDLGDDVQINDALAKHVEPIDKLNTEFGEWFKLQANNLAPKVNWDEPKMLPDDGSAPIAAWNKDHPDSFWGLIFEAEALMLERKWEEAKVPLNKAIDLFPNYSEIDGPYLLLAKADEQLKQEKEERAVLEKFLAINADAVQPRFRYLELASRDEDWKAVRKQSEEAIGVDPLVVTPFRYLAESAEHLGDRATAMDARRVILLMNPLDKPEQHYRLAKLLFEDGQVPQARHECILALENAPRYREALALLLDIAAKMDAAATSSAPAPEPKP